jgi:hypothetical protein
MLTVGLCKCSYHTNRKLQSITGTPQALPASSINLTSNVIFQAPGLSVLCNPLHNTQPHWIRVGSSESTHNFLITLGHSGEHVADISLHNHVRHWKYVRIRQVTHVTFKNAITSSHICICENQNTLKNNVLLMKTYMNA